MKDGLIRWLALGLRARIPPQAKLINISATSQLQAIQLSWQSVQETDLLGFNLYRAESLFGSQIKLNPQLILAHTPGRLAGDAYQHLDDAAVTGKMYYYWIEWVGKSSSEINGPVKATLAEYNLWLPVVLDQNIYTVTITTVGNGSVSRNNPGPYHYGDVVQLTATPATGWRFANWTGDLTGSTNPASITINGNKSVTARFTQNEYTLTVSTVGNGSVSRNNPGPYHYGDVVQLTATPVTGWSFANWTGDLTGSTNPASITINGNKSVTTRFTQNEYTLTVSTVGNGSVSRNNPGPYHYGDVVQLTATPVTGWSFANWTGDLSGNANPASITINGNKSVSARALHKMNTR